MNTHEEDEAVRQFAAATLTLLKVAFANDRGRWTQELRRTVAQANRVTAASVPSDAPVEPLVINVRQAAKRLSISTGTLFNLSAPRGPIPVVKIGARVGYAVKDLDTAIETMKIKPSVSNSPR